MLTSLAEAQVISLTLDPAQSSVAISIDGSAGTSQLSGNATLDIQSTDPLSGNAQITDLNFVADEAFNFSFFFGVVSASTSPGDVELSLVTSGPPGTISGSSFDQLNNLFTFNGDLNISDPFGFAGGSQTVDLSTLELAPFDFDSVDITQIGDVITVTGSFSNSQPSDFGLIAVEATYVATGVVPDSGMLGDVNLDGAVNFLDIAPFIALLSGQEFQVEADFDENGMVDFLDIAPFIAALSGAE